MKQKYTSKDTSVNTTKLPELFKHIPIWLYRDSGIFDYGCGRIETQNLVKKALKDYNVPYYPYDPYHCSKEQNRKSLEFLLTHPNACVICANVLNVIEEDEIVENIMDLFWQWGFVDIKDFSNCHQLDFNRDIYIGIYEGTRTGIGKQTKRDCWQRNLKWREYLNWINHYGCNKYHVPVTMRPWEAKYRIITNQKSLLKK